MVFGLGNKDNDNQPRTIIINFGDRVFLDNFVLTNSGLNHGELVLSVYYTEGTYEGYTFRSFIYSLFPTYNSKFTIGHHQIEVQSIVGDTITIESTIIKE
jgi:hypothetical protein